MTGAALFLLAILWVAPAFVAHAIGKPKHRVGWAYGVFLGWIGVIIIALLPPADDFRYGECPHCREKVRLDASVCPHCRLSVTPSPYPTR